MPPDATVAPASRAALAFVGAFTLLAGLAGAHPLPGHTAAAEEVTDVEEDTLTLHPAERHQTASVATPPGHRFEYEWTVRAPDRAQLAFVVMLHVGPKVTERPSAVASQGNGSIAGEHDEARYALSWQNTGTKPVVFHYTSHAARPARPAPAEPGVVLLAAGLAAPLALARHRRRRHKD